jgi:hypothetical protein
VGCACYTVFFASLAAEGGLYGFFISFFSGSSYAFPNTLLT